MTTAQLQQEILRLKKEKGVCILCHAYQRHELWEVADFVGDSFGLSQQAQSFDAHTVLMCGVRFMAETVKLLSPEKRVLLSQKQAGCPMADQLTPETVLALREQYPDHTVVAYVNTTAATKAVCDVCVTSSSAVQVVRNIENHKILFLPDCNLGAWVQAQVPEKSLQLIQGGCPIHNRITVEDVAAAKATYPDALVLVHPECHPQVTALADYAGSTTGILAYAEKSPAKTFLIGTENSIVEHLQFRCPQKTFYPLSKDCLCADMALTTLNDVYRCLTGEAEEISLPEDILTAARRPLDEMLRLG